MILFVVYLTHNLHLEMIPLQNYTNKKIYIR